MAAHSHTAGEIDARYYPGRNHGATSSQPAPNYACLLTHIRKTIPRHPIAGFARSVQPSAEQTRRTMQSVPAQKPLRKMVTCSHCGLHQYFPANRQCRRCRWSVGNIQFAIPLKSAAEPSGDPDESLRRAIGALLRRLRRRHGISQTAMASLLKTHRSFLSRIEHGHKLPRLSMLAQVCSLLDVEQVILCMRQPDNSESVTSTHDVDRDS